MLLGVLGGGFLEPNPLDYFFGAGIATNIGAALVGIAFGVVWSRTKFWPLHTIHVHLAVLRESHDRLHARHDRHAEHLDRLGRSLIELHEKLDRLEEKAAPPSR